MLPRERRLRSERDWDALFRDGFSVSCPLFALRLKPTAGTRRVGVSVGRKVGGAVVRNLVKRRLRAIVMEGWACLPNADIGILVRPAAAEATLPDLRAALAALSERAARRIVPETVPDHGPETVPGAAPETE